MYLQNACERVIAAASKVGSDRYHLPSPTAGAGTRVALRGSSDATTAELTISICCKLLPHCGQLDCPRASSASEPSASVACSIGTDREREGADRGEIVGQGRELAASDR